MKVKKSRIILTNNDNFSLKELSAFLVSLYFVLPYKIDSLMVSIWKVLKEGIKEFAFTRKNRWEIRKLARMK